jgi:hypothetical protein
VGPHLKRLQQEIASAVAGLSAEELSWHPPGKWCAAEVLEHLYLTYTGTIKAFQRLAAAGKPPDAAATWAQRRRRWVVLGLSYLPSGREAPSFARPRGLAPDNVRAEIERKIGEMDDTIRQCEEQFEMRRNLLDHPILGPLTGNQWRKFHLVHGLHHMKQIRRLKEALARERG